MTTKPALTPYVARIGCDGVDYFVFVIDGSGGMQAFIADLSRAEAEFCAKEMNKMAPGAMAYLCGDNVNNRRTNCLPQ